MSGSIQPYSLFHYLQPKAILTGHVASSDFAVLALVLACAVTYALVVFPRRDLPAPS